MTTIDKLTMVEKIQSEEKYNSWYNVVHKPFSDDSVIFYLPLEDNIVHKHIRLGIGNR